MTSECEVRLATIADVEAIEVIVAAAYQPYLARMERRPAPMSEDYSRVVTAGHTWIAWQGGWPLGVLVLHPEPDHLLVENLAVAPGAQGLGIGARLLAHAEDEARRSGVRELRLYTNEAMTENLDYYPRRGYRETHRGTGDGFARVYFAKLLAPPA